uniref:Uncharacterized protein n=1 Tax=Moniliophthora roreri TaxID=221103 RepID=A0A0W0GF21_MONRR
MKEEMSENLVKKAGWHPSESAEDRYDKVMRDAEELVTGSLAVAFSFKKILNELIVAVEEIVMDSMWKTNALEYKLFAIVAEANSEACNLWLPTAKG